VRRLHLRATTVWDSLFGGPGEYLDKVDVNAVSDDFRNWFVHKAA
jgi:hypothetical protein